MKKKLYISPLMEQYPIYSGILMDSPGLPPHSGMPRRRSESPF